MGCHTKCHTNPNIEMLVHHSSPITLMCSTKHLNKTSLLFPERKTRWKCHVGWSAVMGCDGWDESRWRRWRKARKGRLHTVKRNFFTHQDALNFQRNVLFLMTKHWEKQRMSTKLELILRNVNIFCKNNYTKSKVTHPTQVG